MLRCTFRHLDGIGEKRERALWDSGVETWSDLAARGGEQLSLFGDRDKIQVALAESRSALESDDADFFAQRLPRAEYYRIAMEYPKDTVFLDIETTGLSRFYHYITLVGWSRGGSYGAVVRGGDFSALSKVLAGAKALVTFNGSLFDIPFLKKELGDVPMPAAHIDLRFFSRRVALKGSQKKPDSPSKSSSSTAE